MTIQEYEYHPNNVKAIQWDGTRETAESILERVQEHLRGARPPEEMRYEVSSVGTVFYHGDKAVPVGNYIVFDVSGGLPCVKQADYDEFSYSYRPLPPDKPSKVSDVYHQEDAPHDPDRVIEWLKSVDPDLDPMDVSVLSAWFSDGVLVLYLYKRDQGGSKVLPNPEEVCCEYHRPAGYCKYVKNYQDVPRPYWAEEGH